MKKILFFSTLSLVGCTFAPTVLAQTTRTPVLVRPIINTTPTPITEPAPAVRPTISPTTAAPTLIRTPSEITCTKRISGSCVLFTCSDRTSFNSCNWSCRAEEAKTTVPGTSARVTERVRQAREVEQERSERAVEAELSDARHAPILPVQAAAPAQELANVNASWFGKMWAGIFGGTTKMEEEKPKTGCREEQVDTCTLRYCYGSTLDKSSEESLTSVYCKDIGYATVHTFSAGWCTYWFKNYDAQTLKAQCSVSCESGIYSAIMKGKTTDCPAIMN